MSTKKRTSKTTTTKSAKKKVASKKSAPKMSKSSARKATDKSKKNLVQAQTNTAFWVHNGSILSNLLELKDALEAMEDAVFSYHVTKDKNDFADWVESVLRDPDCAAALRKSKKPHTARTVVVRHLKIYRV